VSEQCRIEQGAAEDTAQQEAEKRFDRFERVDEHAELWHQSKRRRRLHVATNYVFGEQN
jgi:hypothetical protein